MKWKSLTMIFLGLVVAGWAQDTLMPCAAPPFISNVVRPNILLSVDMTGSMYFRASAVFDSASGGRKYDPNRRYYGLFDDRAYYEYSSSCFKKNPSGIFYGNIMNWACMSRIDVAKKVLTGGMGSPPHSMDKQFLEGAGGAYFGYDCFWPCTLSYTSGGRLYRYRFSKPTRRTIRVDTIGPRDPNGMAVGSYQLDIDVRNDTIFRGVIRQIADKDLDRMWDGDAPRFALMFYNTDINVDVVREFYQCDSSPNMEAFFDLLNNFSPNNGTPVGNAVLEAVHYIRYCQPMFGGYIHHSPRTKWDPFFWSAGGGQQVQQVDCAKCFVIQIGDGESNSDWPPQPLGHLPPGPFTPARPLYDYDDNNRYFDECRGSGDSDHPADDYAYYGHITDLRPDNDPNPIYRLPDKQNITFFAVYSFGTTGSSLFWEIAKDGGFIDKNNDNIPQVNEYDENGDGVPDNYYNAQSGQEMEDAIRKIIQLINARISAGSSAAVISSGSRSEGVVHQSLFWPVKFEGANETGWIGLLNSLWVDRFGYIREDSDSNDVLNLKRDYVVIMDSGTATAILYQDTTGRGELKRLPGNVHIEYLKYIWDGGKLLAARDPDDRVIKTGVDRNNNGIVEPNECIDFSLANEAVIIPHLGVPNDTGRAIIRWVRGQDIAPYRTRQLGGQTWKLGDIVYSTNTYVGKPMEGYSLIYYDRSYQNFYNHYKYAAPPPPYNGRNDAIYVGANDGMLHCFNAGKYIENKTVSKDTIPGYLDGWNEQLGKELWTYIPYNLLPHLKWMLDKKYCHVYYVDLKPYLTDVQIFNADAVHDSGWGTILIGGMRLGGTPIKVGTTVYHSAYFAFDVTDPKNPQFLWEYTDTCLGLTTCFPTVAKVGSNWFLIFGSGPKSNKGVACSTTAKIYVLDLKTGQRLRRFDLAVGDSICGDITAVDFGLNFSTDRIYFGTYNTKSTSGRLCRISTGIPPNENPDPNAWTLDTVITVDRSIVAGPSITLDPENNLWVYFGTGKLFSDQDEADTTHHRFFGVKDSGKVTIGELYDVTGITVWAGDSVFAGNVYLGSYDTLLTRIRARRGWWREFDKSERCLAKSLVIGGAVIFTTTLPPDSICSYGGRGNLYALYYLTGCAYRKAILGVVARQHVAKVAVSGGMPTQPGLFIGSDRERAFIQSATGGIKTINLRLPFAPRGGLGVWKGR